MESNFQLVNVPVLSREGEKPGFICVLHGIGILIHFDTRLTDYLNIESPPVRSRHKFTQVHQDDEQLCGEASWGHLLIGRLRR